MKSDFNFNNHILSVPMSCLVDSSVINSKLNQETSIEQIMYYYFVLREINEKVRAFESEVENYINDLIENNNYDGSILAPYFKTKMTEALQDQSISPIFYKIAWMEGNNKAVLKFQETHPEAPKLTAEI